MVFLSSQSKTGSYNDFRLFSNWLICQRVANLGKDVGELPVIRKEATGRFNNPMDIKPRPNHLKYLDILRSMTPEQRLLKAFQLSKFSKRLFLAGLRHRFENLSEAELRVLATKRLEKCHNRNY